MVSIQTIKSALSEADVKLLRWIGQSKRLRIDQAARLTKRPLPEVRGCVNRLEQEGWLEYSVMLAKEKDENLLTLWLTGAGLEAVGLKPSFYRGLPSLANLSHDFSLVEIGLALFAEDPKGEYVPERLVADTFGFGRELVDLPTGEQRRSHRPDGVFKCSDGSVIIVECETGTKDREAREWMMLQNEEYVLPGGEVCGTTNYYGHSADVRTPIQLTQEQRHLQRVEILETPGEILWPAGSRITR